MYGRYAVRIERVKTINLSTLNSGKDSFTSFNHNQNDLAEKEGRLLRGSHNIWSLK